MDARKATGRLRVGFTPSLFRVCDPTPQLFSHWEMLSHHQEVAKSAKGFWWQKCWTIQLCGMASPPAPKQLWCSQLTPSHLLAPEQGKAQPSCCFRPATRAGQHHLLIAARGSIRMGAQGAKRKARSQSSPGTRHRCKPNSFFRAAPGGPQHCKQEGRQATP